MRLGFLLVAVFGYSIFAADIAVIKTVDKYHKGTFSKLPSYSSLSFGAKTAIGWSKKLHSSFYGFGFREYLHETKRGRATWASLARTTTIERSLESAGKCCGLSKEMFMIFTGAPSFS